jgi:hypothetical protein
MVRNVSEFSMCSLKGDTVQSPCTLLLIGYLLCLGQRKRERLRSLETRLHASATNVTYALDEETPLQHPTTPLLPGLYSLDTPNSSLHDPYQAFKTGAADTSCMYLPSHELACNTSAASSSHVGSQFEMNTTLSYGMAYKSKVHPSCYDCAY